MICEAPVSTTSSDSGLNISLTFINQHIEARYLVALLPSVDIGGLLLLLIHLAVWRI
jgi:hypothetical protein